MTRILVPTLLLLLLPGCTRTSSKDPKTQTNTPDAAADARAVVGAPTEPTPARADTEGPEALTISEASDAGLLSPLDRKLYERLRLDLGEGDALADEVRRAAREKDISAEEYAAYRAILASQPPPAVELEQVAGQLVKASEEQGAGVARAYALADVLHCLAEGAERGPSRWFQESLAPLQSRLTTRRETAASDVAALLANQATEEGQAKLKALLSSQKQADGERVLLPVLERLVKGPTRVGAGIDLPATP